MEEFTSYFELYDLYELGDSPLKELSSRSYGPLGLRCAGYLLSFQAKSLQSHIKSTGYYPLVPISMVCPRCLAVMSLSTQSIHWDIACRGNEQRYRRNRNLSKRYGAPIKEIMLVPMLPHNYKEPTSLLTQHVMRILLCSGDALDFSLDLAIFIVSRMFLVLLLLYVSRLLHRTLISGSSGYIQEESNIYANV